MDLLSSAQRLSTKNLVVSIVIGILAVSALSTATMAQVNPVLASKQEREEFRLKMSRIALPSKGCFVAHHPTAAWVKVDCGSAPRHVFPIARVRMPNTVGAGADNFLQATGTISSATGSFDSVTGVTSESGPRLGNPTPLYPNTYSLQLNANLFTTSVCNNAPGCMGWEQFVFSQSECNAACAFIEYWLINYPSPCPAGGWIYYPGSSTTGSGCYMNTQATTVPALTLSDLGSLELNGTVSSSTDTVQLSTPDGDVHVSSQDSLLHLAQGWTGGEFNVFGDCCALEATFNVGSQLTVRLSADNGTTNAPSCNTSSQGATAETNNLNLTGPCTTVGGASPAIVFSEGLILPAAPTNLQGVVSSQ